MTSSRVSPLDAALEDPAWQELIVKIQETSGRFPTPFRLWMQSPTLAALLEPLGAFLANGTSLTRRESEIAILTIARYWRATYVFAVHVEEAVSAGLTMDVMSAIVGNRAPDLIDQRERMVHRTLAVLAAHREVDDATFEEATASLGHQGVAELLSLAGYFTSISLAMKFYAVSPPQR